MLEKIKAKMTEIVEAILAKPTSDLTKNDFDILAGEYMRLKMEIDSAENNKRLAETLNSIWKK